MNIIKRYLGMKLLWQYLSIDNETCGVKPKYTESQFKIITITAQCKSYITKIISFLYQSGR